MTLFGVAAAQRKPAADAKPAAQTKKKTAARAGKKTTSAKASAKTVGEDAQKSELDEIVKLDAAGHIKLSAAERVERLQAFVKDHPDSTQLLRARELLT